MTGRSRFTNVLWIFAGLVVAYKAIVQGFYEKSIRLGQFYPLMAGNAAIAGGIISLLLSVFIIAISIRRLMSGEEDD